MGEAKATRKRRQHVLVGERRCIYCEKLPNSVEHMPPKVMFRSKSRPDGMVFATCTTCNNGTSTADLIAGFVCRIRMDAGTTDWELLESYVQLNQIGRKAPDFIREFFHPARNQPTLRRNAAGIVSPAHEIRVDGPVTKAYLNTFSAKFGMALFREHTGAPLPMTGRVFSQWFTNAGLTRDTAAVMLSILPAHATLAQGKWSVSNQFSYRYNTDERTIVAGLAAFQQGLYVQVIVTSEPEKNPFFITPEIMKRPTTSIVGPGGLLKMMASRTTPLIV